MSASVHFGVWDIQTVPTVLVSRLRENAFEFVDKIIDNHEKVFQSLRVNFTEGGILHTQLYVMRMLPIIKTMG